MSSRSRHSRPKRSRRKADEPQPLGPPRTVKDLCERACLPIDLVLESSAEDWRKISMEIFGNDIVEHARLSLDRANLKRQRREAGTHNSAHSSKKRASSHRSRHERIRKVDVNECADDGTDGGCDSDSVQIVEPPPSVDECARKPMQDADVEPGHGPRPLEATSSRPSAESDSDIEVWCPNDQDLENDINYEGASFDDVPTCSHRKKRRLAARHPEPRCARSRIKARKARRIKVKRSRPSRSSHCEPAIVQLSATSLSTGSAVAVGIAAARKSQPRLHTMIQASPTRGVPIEAQPPTHVPSMDMSPQALRDLQPERRDERPPKSQPSSRPGVSEHLDGVASATHTKREKTIEPCEKKTPAANTAFCVTNDLDSIPIQIEQPAITVPIEYNRHGLHKAKHSKEARASKRKREPTEFYFDQIWKTQRTTLSPPAKGRRRMGECEVQRINWQPDVFVQRVLRRLPPRHKTMEKSVLSTCMKSVPDNLFGDTVWKLLCTRYGWGSVRRSAGRVEYYENVAVNKGLFESRTEVLHSMLTSAKWQRCIDIQAATALVLCDISKMMEGVTSTTVNDAIRMSNIESMDRPVLGGSDEGCFAYFRIKGQCIPTKKRDRLVTDQGWLTFEHSQGMSPNRKGRGERRRIIGLYKYSDIDQARPAGIAANTTASTTVVTTPTTWPAQVPARNDTPAAAKSPVPANQQIATKPPTPTTKAVPHPPNADQAWREAMGQFQASNQTYSQIQASIPPGKTDTRGRSPGGYNTLAPRNHTSEALVALSRLQTVPQNAAAIDATSAAGLQSHMRALCSSIQGIVDSVNRGGLSTNAYGTGGRQEFFQADAAGGHTATHHQTNLMAPWLGLQGGINTANPPGPSMVMNGLGQTQNMLQANAANGSNGAYQAGMMSQLSRLQGGVNNDNSVQTLAAMNSLVANHQTSQRHTANGYTGAYSPAAMMAQSLQLQNKVNGANLVGPLLAMNTGKARQGTSQASFFGGQGLPFEFR